MTRRRSFGQSARPQGVVEMVVDMMRVGKWLGCKRARLLVLVLALAGALILLALRGFDTYLGRFGSVGSLDFVEYWSAARLVMDGGNPYDPTALLAVERAAGWPWEDPLPMWNPPWTLALVLPVALLPFGVASFVWLLVQLGLLLVSGLLLWRYFAAQEGREWLSFYLVVGFFPSLSALKLGQISPWMLLGLIGFLWAERQRQDWVAGASLSLLMIKPHVTYLFLAAALWWAWRRERWSILVGWIAGLIGTSTLVLSLAPPVFRDYVGAVRVPEWITPTVGGWLRVALGMERTWLQFLPSVLGGCGLVLWLWRRRGPWCWEALAGPLLLASVMTAAFGWSFDQVVLLPPVVAIVSGLRAQRRLKRGVILLALVGAQVGLAAMNHWGVNDAFAVWHAPLLGLLYLWVASGEPARVET